MKRISPLLFLLIFVLPFRSFSQCSLPKPSNVKVSTVLSCQATVTWNAVPGAAYYVVKFKPDAGTSWTFLPDHITGTSFTFTGLTPNVYYVFGIASVCANNVNSGYKQVKKTTQLCTTPTNVVASNLTNVSASISWTGYCGTTNFKIRYKKNGTTKWTNLPSTSLNPYTLAGLTANTSYDLSVQALCTFSDTSKWTPKMTFKTKLTAPPPPTTKPNFVVIVTDDGRYDTYIPTGGPSWFTSPSVTRIANEGANFLYAFPTTSQCAPSRVSIYTGLLANHNGAIDNTTRMNDSLPLVQQILHDNGYYTGFIGKYGQFQGDPTGFDYWVTSDGNIYVDAPFKINGGQDTIIEGHISDIYQDYAMNFLNSVPANKHFMLMFFTRVPHGPTIPRDEDLSLFTTETMPFPTNFYKYTTNYPSYFYGTHTWNWDTEETDSVRLKEFQCLQGVENNTTAFLNWLETRGILDSTMVIYTSDNGFMKGEHKLDAKQIMQEESIRVPLFIRYPAWFPAGSTYANKMAANIDIAPTILEAAGIPNTFGMDGMSLKGLADNSLKRTYFFYQYAGEQGGATIRGIRSLQYKYVKHYCNQVTEEFYDLVNDPHENVNLINNSSFSVLISSYRTKMDSIRTAVNDYTIVNASCYLSNPQKEGSIDDEHESVNDRLLRLWPNPAASYFLVNFNEAGNQEDILITVTNPLGQVVYSKNILNTDVLNAWVQCEEWSPGIYMVILKKGTQTYTDKIIIGQ